MWTVESSKLLRLQLWWNWNVAIIVDFLSDASRAVQLLHDGRTKSDKTNILWSTRLDLGSNVVARRSPTGLHCIRWLDYSLTLVLRNIIDKVQSCINNKIKVCYRKHVQIIKRFCLQSFHNVYSMIVWRDAISITTTGFIGQNVIYKIGIVRAIINKNIIQQNLHTVYLNNKNNKVKTAKIN